MNPFARPTKYNAQKTEYGGVVFDSRAEAAYARYLDLLLGAEKVEWWLRQVPVMVGEPGVDKPWRVDFLVSEGGVVSAREVKGFETAQFKRQLKQWRKRGPFPLHVIKGKKVEVVKREGE